MNNVTIARRLIDYARELDTGHSNLYRIRAYRWAASSIGTMDRPLTEVFEKKGRAGLAALPGIGAHLAYTIAELIRTGEFKTWPQRNSSRASLQATTRCG